MKAFSIGIAIAVLIIGTTVLAGGWVFDNELLKRLYPAFPAMVPSTAICFILLSASAILPDRSFHSTTGYGAARAAFALLVLLVAGGNLVLLYNGTTNGIDAAIWRDHPEFARDNMAPITSVCFIGCALSLLVVPLRYSAFRLIILILLFFGLFLSLAAVLGYVFDRVLLSNIPFIATMALHTALCFVALFCALLLSREELGVRRVLVGDGRATRYARELFPFVVLLPFVLSLAALEVGRLDWFWSNQLITMLAIFITSTLAGTIIQNAVTDTTEERDHLLQLSGRLNAVLEAARSGIFGLDKDGTILIVNPTGRHMLGGISHLPPFRWPDTIIFLDPEDLHPLELSANPVKRIIAGQSVKGETAIMSRAGSDNPRYVRVTSALISGDPSASVRYVIVIDDISEQEKNRQQIERSSRLDALGQLTGGIAHDFNNLLATIQYAVQLAAKDETSEAKTKYLQTALTSVKRGADLTQRLLAFAKRQPGVAKTRLVADVIYEFAELVTPTIEEKLSLSFSVERSDLWVFCDIPQLENALLNLVLNSRDAIIREGKGSKIVVSARAVAEIDSDAVLRRENPHTYIAKGLHAEHSAERLRDDGRVYRYIEFAVTDNGPGMSDEVKRRALDPFFTTKAANSGTGLGLSMVYGFIQQANGELRLYSEVGLGTTVRMLLPRGTPSGEREAPVDRLPAPTGKGQRIMVVEDEENLLTMVCDLLDALGYQVVQAHSGRDALALIDRGEQFNLLLTDVVMPGGVGGFELAQEVRKKLPEMPVIYMSGYTGFSKEEVGQVTAPVVQKPCPPSELASLIREALKDDKPD